MPSAPVRPRRARPATRADFAAVSDAELVARLLGTGEPESRRTAERLLAGRGLRRLIPFDAVTLHHLGASTAGSARLAAAYELARRLAAAPLEERAAKLSSPDSLVHYLALHHTSACQEIMGALFLDAHLRVIADREFFRGTLRNTSVDPKPLLKEALLHNSAGLALYHNHPSGDPSPSYDDFEWTHRMRLASDLLGIELVDHLIITYQGSWTSLRKLHPW
jgi:DNA repair protein RadC